MSQTAGPDKKRAAQDPRSSRVRKRARSSGRSIAAMQSASNSRSSPALALARATSREAIGPMTCAIACVARATAAGLIMPCITEPAAACVAAGNGSVAGVGVMATIRPASTAPYFGTGGVVNWCNFSDPGVSTASSNAYGAGDPTASWKSFDQAMSNSLGAVFIVTLPNT